MHYTSINKESKSARKKRDGSILFISSHGGKPLRTVDLIWVYIKNTTWQNIYLFVVMAYACACVHINLVYRLSHAYDCAYM